VRNNNFKKIIFDEITHPIGKNARKHKNGFDCCLEACDPLLSPT